MEPLQVAKADQRGGHPGQSRQGRSLGLSARLETTDAHRWLLPAALGVLGVCSLFAINGSVPSGLPMPTFAVGVVTPTCGLTRGVTAILAGQFATAWRFNPASYVVVAIAAAVLLRTAVGFTRRRWVNLSFAVSPAGWAVAVALVTALWVNQQANADFVMHARL